MKRRVRWIACSAALVLGASAFWQGLQVTRDCVYSDKVSRIVRFAVVTDLHSTWYGEAQSGLIDAITREDPDAVLLAGDIVDDERPRDAAKAFLQAVIQKYPTYYVLGNHEFRIPAPEEVKDWARDLGVTVLDGTGETVTLNNQTVRICGVDDPRVARSAGRASLTRCAAWRRIQIHIRFYCPIAPNAPTSTQTPPLTWLYPVTHTAARSESRFFCRVA